jgi:hypothetical protein
MRWSGDRVKAPLYRTCFRDTKKREIEAGLSSVIVSTYTKISAFKQSHRSIGGLAFVLATTFLLISKRNGSLSGFPEPIFKIEQNLDYRSNLLMFCLSANVATALDGYASKTQS